jgi:hypothetical protein
MPVVAEAPFSAAAHAFQVAIEQQSTTPTSTASPAAHPDMAKDVVMSDFIPDRHAVSLPSLPNCDHC